MTARSLHKGLPACNMRSAIKQNNKMLIVVCILQTLGVPVIMGSFMLQMWQEAIFEKYRYNVFSGLELYAIIAALIFGIAVLLGSAIAISVFRELWKKHDVDMMYALPLTGTQRFFSHYLAGAVIYLLPYVVAVIVGWIILLGGSCAIDFEFLDQTRGEFLAEACQYYLLASLGMFLLMWMYYTTTALITVCCGTVFESTYTTLLLNGLVPGTFAAVLAVICDNISAFSFEYLWQPIGYTSPAGGLIYLFYILSGGFDTSYSGWYSVSGSEATDHGMVPAFIRWALIITLLVSITLVAAWKLYQHRKAESVSRPFVYLGVYYLMLTALTVLILCLLNTGVDAFAPIIIFAGVIYFLMEVIRKRGFRRFWVSVISFVLTVSLTIGIFAAVIKTNAFGTVYRIPSLSSISSVKIEMSTPFSEDISLEYTNKDVIRAVRELHQDITEDLKRDNSTTEKINAAMEELDYKHLEYSAEYTDTNRIEDGGVVNPLNENRYYTVDPEAEYSMKYQNYVDYWTEYVSDVEMRDRYSYADTEYVQLTYFTRTGSTVNRYYDINIDQYKQLLEIIYGTELYADGAADRMLERLTDDLTQYDHDTNIGAIPDRMQMSITSDISIFDNPQHVYVNGGEAMLGRIADCYRRDLKNMKNGEQLTSGVFCKLHDVTIWNSCTETIALLRELGFREFTVAEKFGLGDSDQYVDYTEYGQQIRSLHMRLYAPGDYAFAAETTKVAFVGGNNVYVRPESAMYEDIYYRVNDVDMEKLFPEVMALLDVVQKVHLSEGSCYMLVINGDWYAVPADKSDLAQAVIDLPEGHFEKTFEKYWQAMYGGYSVNW